MERVLEKEAEKLLIEYSGGVMRINREHPEGQAGVSRMRAFDKLRKSAIKRIKGLVAEFGK